MEPVVPFSVKVAAFFCLLLHLGFFTLEAAWFPSKTATFKAAEPAGELIIGDFTTTGRDNAKSLRIFAFNMGCYNLLLAAGVAYSLAISWKFQSEARTLLTYLCCVMIAAGIVLGLTASWLWIPALAQSGLAAICLALLGGTRHLN